jgi:hypothetical protein
VNESLAMRHLLLSLRRNIQQHDDGLEWLRDIRRAIAAEANNDPAEMGRRLRQREKQVQGRLFKTRRVLVPVGADKAA